MASQEGEAGQLQPNLHLTLDAGGGRGGTGTRKLITMPQKVLAGGSLGTRALASYHPALPPGGNAAGALRAQRAREQARAVSWAWTQQCAQGHREDGQVTGSWASCWSAGLGLQEPAPLPAPSPASCVSLGGSFAVPGPPWQAHQ